MLLQITRDSLRYLVGERTSRASSANLVGDLNLISWLTRSGDLINQRRYQEKKCFINQEARN